MRPTAMRLFMADTPIPAARERLVRSR